MIGAFSDLLKQDEREHLWAVQLRRLLVFDLLCYTQTIAFTELVAFIIVTNSHINYI